MEHTTTTIKPTQVYSTSQNRKRRAAEVKEEEEEEQRLRAEPRRSARSQTDDKVRWSVLVALLDMKSEELVRSSWNVLTPSVLEQICKESRLSITQVRSIWAEYVAQHDGKKGFKQFSMVSNKHGQAMKKGSSAQWVDDCASHDKDSRRHHYRVRYDDKGTPYPIEKVVEAIGMVNNDLRQVATIREISVELLRLRGLYVPRTTLNKILKDFKFDTEISHVKPRISIKLQRRRLMYVLSQLAPDESTHNVGGQECVEFSSHKNRV